MPTIVTNTVKETGGDYSLLSTAVGAVSSSLIATDEQWNIEVSTKSGGYADSVTIPTITSDATRYLEIRAATGDEYHPFDDSGAFLIASVGFAGVFTNNTTSFLRLKNIGFKNTRTATSGRCVDFFGNDGTISGVYATTASTSGAIVYFMNNANNLSISDCLSYLGTTGFDFGNNSTRTANKLTSIDASAVGIDTGTANTTLTNSLSLGSVDPYLGTFNTSSDYNAGDSTDTPTAGNSFNNRTTSDLVDYASNDFRTALSSPLSTGGSVDFIGYALESASGITVTGATVNYPYSSISGSIDLTGSIDVTGQTPNAIYATTPGAIDLTGEISVIGSTASYLYAAENGDIDLTGAINVVGQAASYNYQQVSGAIDLTGEVTVVGATPSYSYSSVNGVIELGALISVIGQTPNYNYAGVSGEVVLAGEISVSGQTPNYSYSTISGFITIGEGQTIGNVTAGFADDVFSAGFKPSVITVNFKT